MVYRFAEIDLQEEIIANEYEHPQALQGGTTVRAFHAMAVFRQGEHVLPLSYEAVTMLLQMENSDLHAAELRKGELMKARNAFVSMRWE